MKALCTVPPAESARIRGGKNEKAAEVVEQIATGIGLVCKLVWKVLKELGDKLNPPGPEEKED